MSSSMPVPDALAALDGSYSAITGVASRLAGADFELETRCDAWTVRDVLFHVLADAQRALRTLVTPSDEPADVDYISYWEPWRPGTEEAAEGARYFRAGAAAFEDPRWLVGLLTETAEAACRSAHICKFEAVTTQGHVLETADFIATLAVEATIHFLDMTLRLEDAQPATPYGLALVRRTLDGLLGSGLPTDWDDMTYALKGTGRLALSPDDEAALGSLAGRFPLFG